MNDPARAIGNTHTKTSAKAEAWHWLPGAAITVFVVGAVAFALFAMPRAVEANRRACLAAYADDLHADFAAFGQDPAWHTHYLDALAACARPAP